MNPFFQKLRSFLLRRRKEQDLRDELQFPAIIRYLIGMTSSALCEMLCLGYRCDIFRCRRRRFPLSWTISISL